MKIRSIDGRHTSNRRILINRMSERNHSGQFRYLVIDIETSGQHQTKNNMLCFGACIGNSLTGTIEDEFEVYLRHPSINWEQACLDNFWNKPENETVRNSMMAKIENEGVDPNTAVRRFYDWINNRTKEYIDSLIIVADTAGYDVGFLNHYLSNADLPSINYIFGGKYRPSRDSSSFHMGVAQKLPVEGLWGAEKAALVSLGEKNPDDVLAQNPYKHTHNPKDDAKSICWEIMLIHRLIELNRSNKLNK